MTDDKTLLEAEKTVMTWIALLVDKFGPTSFGVIIVILMYVFIAKPELDRNRITFEEERILIQQLQQVVHDRKDVAITYLQAAEIHKGASDTVLKSAELLDSISQRLETLTDKLIDRQIKASNQ